MAELPIAPVKRLARVPDKDIRIGDEAAAFLVAQAEKVVVAISKEAWDLTKYAGRKTIQVADIEKAISKIGTIELSK